MDNFAGKVAVITGAASGIGLALAKKSAALGMRVAMSDINADELAQAREQLPADAEVLTVVCDVAKEAQVASFASQVFEQWGAAHALFNNAGVGAGGAIWELDAEYWRWVMDINFYGVIHGIQQFVPRMIEQGEGHVVNTASIAGLMSAPSTGPYTVSKHAVVALSELLYGDLRKVDAGVGVSVLCPSFVNTHIYEMQKHQPMDEATRNDPARIAEQEAIEQATAEFFQANAIAPEQVADQVFAAIEGDNFYILTHPNGSREQIELRMRAILDDGAPPATGPENYPMN